MNKYFSYIVQKLISFSKWNLQISKYQIEMIYKVENPKKQHILNMNIKENIVF